MYPHILLFPKCRDSLPVFPHSYIQQPKGSLLDFSQTPQTQLSFHQSSLLRWPLQAICCSSPADVQVRNAAVILAFLPLPNPSPNSPYPKDLPTSFLQLSPLAPHAHMLSLFSLAYPRMLLAPSSRSSGCFF